MRVALTGITGFIGKHLAHHLLAAGHQVKAWYRPGADQSGFSAGEIQWLKGALGDLEASRSLVADVDVVIHAALQHTPGRYRGGHDDLLDYLQTNLMGSIALLEHARSAGVSRFIYVSSRAVYDERVPGMPLNELHPTWPRSHYGAQKAAMEMFVHSFGVGDGFPVCSIRPTGVYGIARPIEASKWFGIIQSVARGEPVTSTRAGTEVHIDDLARAILCLMEAPGIAGQCFNCSDLFVSDQEVGELAKVITGSCSPIAHTYHPPVNVMECDRLRALGVRFGGRTQLEAYVRQLLEEMKHLPGLKTRCEWECVG